MRKAKYVVIEIDNASFSGEVPILFPELVTHLCVAGSLLIGPVDPPKDESWKDKVVSAGFVEISSGIVRRDDPLVVVECYGASITLGKNSRPEDARLIKKSLGIS